MDKARHQVKDLLGSAAREPAGQGVGNGFAVQPRRGHPRVYLLMDAIRPGLATDASGGYPGEIQIFHSRYPMFYLGNSFKLRGFAALHSVGVDIAQKRRWAPTAPLRDVPVVVATRDVSTWEYSQRPAR